MCKDSVNTTEPEEEEKVADDTHVRARCETLCDGTWVVGLKVGPEHPARCNQQSTRFHFVLDNSGSMGRNSENAKQCFADLIALATKPCSLTVFANSAEVLGEKFEVPARLKLAKLPPQGQTNITEGMLKALDIITQNEKLELEQGLERTHHVLVLLSDGAHNRGSRPEDVLPNFGAELRAGFPALRLSVVVVGVTANSNTSMGMLMKQSLETVALPALQPIYFASTPAAMVEALAQMREGFASLQGSVLTVKCPDGCNFVRAVGDVGVPSIDLLVESHEQTLMCLGSAPPSHLEIDGVVVPCVAAATTDLDVDLATMALSQLIDAVRLHRIAVGASGIRAAVQQLRTWISALETVAAERHAARSATPFTFARSTPLQRLEQHRAVKRTTQGARELLNQLAEIEAHNANDSASQAAFLVGAQSKFGAKALRRAVAHRDGVVDPAQRLDELVADIKRIAPKMKEALRKDFCGKLSTLSQDARMQLQKRLSQDTTLKISVAAIQGLCFDHITLEMLELDAELAELVDSGAAIEAMLALSGGARHSYLSLNSAWEQLKDWCNAADVIGTCATEYQLLMCLGAIGYPIQVQRFAATQMDPYAMSVTRIHSSIADTASLLTALHSDQSIVPPEGGVAIEDMLVLVDPDVPCASRLAAKSMLLKETYTSIVLCRDLHMFIGNKMQIALHAHALLATLQPPAKPSKQDIEAQLRRQYLGRAYQCAQCGFGPIDHFACGDLQAHHGEEVGGATVNNACPRCDWFSECIDDWPAWNGKVPKEALEQHSTGPNATETQFLTAASVEMALRICYSARAMWQVGPDSDAADLCKKLANWESLTTADNVDHPVQLLLALAVVDDCEAQLESDLEPLRLPVSALEMIPTRSLLNEVCARRARIESKQLAGADSDEHVVLAAARKRAAGFLGVKNASAPYTKPLEESEPKREAVMEACCGDYALDTESFDFKGWVRDVLQPWVTSLIFVRRLRSALQTREGGWPQLAKDMEVGAQAYADLVQVLQKPAGNKESLRAFLGIERQSDAPRVLATITAQAFLHQSSQLRRTIDKGGSLSEPLGDVGDSNTLRALCIELRMATYSERVAAKMREWSKLGTSLTYQRARATDLNEYSHMCGSHVHGLDKQTFWGLWNAASGEKAKEFLCRANQGFNSKYGSPNATDRS